MKEVNPIKRNKAFVSFSKDHHFGLLLVWKIRRDLKNTVSSIEITDYVLEFFRDNLYRHFKEEEECIFTKLPPGDDWRKRAEAEHATIYHLIELIRRNPDDKEFLNEFADLLENHIRFEERILFNYLQERLTAEELDDILSNKNDDNS